MGAAIMVRGIESLPPQRLFLDGPVGRLHGTFERPVAEPRAAVLHLHPHPMHGGTRQNNVVRHGALGSLEAGCAALRIDFRGVGLSAGHYDEGDGEIDDAAAAFAWLQKELPGIPVFVWGFSFGSRVGLDFTIRQRDPQSHPPTVTTATATNPADGYMAVAWPTRFYAWPHSHQWPERASFLVGSKDDFVEMAGMQRAEEQGGNVTIVDGATHFFPGQLDSVREWTRDTLEAWL